MKKLICLAAMLVLAGCAKTEVVVTMHDQNGKYWITDVKVPPKQ